MPFDIAVLVTQLDYVYLILISTWLGLPIQSFCFSMVERNHDFYVSFWILQHELQLEVPDNYKI